MSEREGRAYKTIDLPTLTGQSSSVEQRALLLKLYEETSSAWRMLVDVRFKLLALVPSVSLLSLVSLLGGDQSIDRLPSSLKLIFSVLGFVVVIGLLVYDIRNSQLHDDLISRARKIESELGVDTGIFLGRKSPKGFIMHSVSTSLIYGASICSWLIAIFESIKSLTI